MTDISDQANHHVRRVFATIAIGIASLTINGCSVELLREHPLGCRLDEQRLVRDTLYFGQSIPGGGEVSESEWNAFVASQILPAFPNGFTLLDGTGYWPDTQGQPASEASHILIVDHGDDAAQDARVRNVIAAYRTRFHQEAVLRERNNVCVTL